MRPANVFLACIDSASPAEQFRKSGAGVLLVERMEDADFVLIPHVTRHLTPKFTEHLNETIRKAEPIQIPVVIIIGGDLGYRIHVEKAIVCKVSIYRHAKRKNEVAVPARVEDFWSGVSFVPRSKQKRPSVSFCGYAGFPSVITRVKYLLRNAALDFLAIVRGEPHWRAHKRGIYFRRHAIRLLQNDSRIETRFIMRDAFFLNVARTELERERARREFLDNMRDADFVLTPKGDGNYSIRFFEALSMGRIPILIDTDMVLPLEGVIDYSKFILRVPHTEMHTLPDRIMELWNSLSDEEFQSMQKVAREAYVKYLNQEAFYNTLFPLLKERGPEAL